MNRYLLAIVILFLSTATYSAIDRNINDKNIAAMVDGEAITVKALDVFYRQAAPGDFRTTRESVLKDLIDNRLLAVWREDSGLVPMENSVGFATKIAVAGQLTGLVREDWRQPLQDWQNELPGGISSFIEERHLPEQAALSTLLENRNPMAFVASDQQLAQFSQTVLLRYHFPDRERQTITLRDIYDLQNIQGRIQLSRAKPAFVAQQVDQLLGNRIVEYWAEEHSGLTHDDLQSIKTVLMDRRERETVLRSLGLFNVMHSSNPVLRQVAEAVSSDEVAEYYRKNLKQFSRLEAVKAFHIQLESQKKADDVYLHLNEGLDFSEAVRKYSVVVGRPKDDSGSLGWLARTSKTPDWLESMAFMQKPGIPSRPVKRPEEAGEPATWEIILVTEQKKGHYPADSETVRYLASRQIALQKANEQFDRLKDQLRKEVPIRLNPDYIGAF